MDRSREAFADPLACMLKGYLLMLSIVFENFNVLSAFFDAFGVTRSVIVLAHSTRLVEEFQREWQYLLTISHNISTESSVGWQISAAPAAQAPGGYPQP